MKKVYLFYLMDYTITKEKYPAINEDDIQDGNHKQYIFYAWTPNKKVRNRFKAMRNMDLFFERTKEVENEHEFEEFTNEYSQYLLEDRALTTKIIRNGIIRTDVVLVLSTSNEVDHIIFNYFDGLLDTDLIFNDNRIPLINTSFFSEPYKNALEKLRFDEIISWICPMEDECLPFNPVSTDALSVFVHIYNNIFRKDIDKICESMNFSENQISRKTTRIYE